VHPPHHDAKRPRGEEEQKGENSAATGGPIVFTIGHGARSLDELVAVLRAAGAERVLDVRAFPASRRHPQFGRAALEESLPREGIGYEWRGDVLGGRRRSVGRSRHGAWREPAFRAYADHTDSRAFRAAIERIVEDAQAGARDAVMCAETLWWRCHRRLVSDALVVRGMRVLHLLSVTSTQAHALSDIARVGEDGWPVWDVGVLSGIL
jgi:uncharacterized protein (DUF488 family)